jgi:hypothetical protein
VEAQLLDALGDRGLGHAELDRSLRLRVAGGEESAEGVGVQLGDGHGQAAVEA